MAVQMYLTSLDGIPEALRAEYRQEGERFILQLEGGEGDDAIASLRSAKDHEKNLRVAAESKVTELTTQLEAARADLTRVTAERDQARADKGADVAALETSWQAKVEAAEAKVTQVEGELTSEIERLLVTNTSITMAAEISTIPDLMTDIIGKRLKVEKGADGKYFTRVLAEDGTPSANTLDDLKKELLANKKYAPIMIAGKGSGGGAGGSGSGGGADEKKYLDYSDAELSEMRKTDRAKYDRLRAAHDALPA